LIRFDDKDFIKVILDGDCHKPKLPPP